MICFNYLFAMTIEMSLLCCYDLVSNESCDEMDRRKVGVV